MAWSWPGATLERVESPSNVTRIDPLREAQITTDKGRDGMHRSKCRSSSGDALRPSVHRGQMRGPKIFDRCQGPVLPTNRSLVQKFNTICD